ncbi:MAG: hypothetical protein R2848_09800 [Thermomicrobiales bacterium]
MSNGGTMMKKSTRLISLLSVVLLALTAIGPLSGTISAQEDRPVLVHATNALATRRPSIRTLRPEPRIAPW